MIAASQLDPASMMKLAAALAGGVLLALTLATRLRRRPSSAEVEERPRLHLAEHGRIVDGSIIDAAPSELQPQTITYQYRIAGVTYECAQDVSSLPGVVQKVNLEYPVQVRYNRANPGDSIVVSESWNGLWTEIWSTPKARR